MTNDGWGKLPTNGDGWGKPVPAANVMIQLQNAGEFIAKVDAEMAKDGWTRTASDEWSKTVPAGSTTTREDLPSWPTATAIEVAEDNNVAVDWPAVQNKFDDIWESATTHGAWPVASAETLGGSFGPQEGVISDSRIVYSAKPDVAIELNDFANTVALDPEEYWKVDALSGASNRAAVINSLRGVKDQYTIDQDGELSNIKETIANPSDKNTGVYIAYSNGKWLHAILSGPYATRKDAEAWTDAAFYLFVNDNAFKLAFENDFNRDGVYYAEIPLSAKRHGAYGVLS